MRAIVCRRYGPPEDLELAELPRPARTCRASRKATGVFGTAAEGAFAERAVLTAGQVTTMPERAGFTEAAAFGVTYRTAYHALRVGQDRS
jgi:NADPH:quinone reductase-like Zn-dependent oxidoreductase